MKKSTTKSKHWNVYEFLNVVDPRKANGRAMQLFGGNMQFIQCNIECTKHPLSTYKNGSEIFLIRRNLMHIQVCKAITNDAGHSRGKYKQAILLHFLISGLHFQIYANRNVISDPGVPWKMADYDSASTAYAKRCHGGQFPLHWALHSGYWGAPLILVNGINQLKALSLVQAFRRLINGSSMWSVSSGVGLTHACTSAALSPPSSSRTGKQLSLRDQSLAPTWSHCPISVRLHIGDLAHTTKATQITLLSCPATALCANKRDYSVLRMISFWMHIRTPQHHALQ